MAVFNVQILNDSPALLVEVQDAGVPAVTYSQIRNSLGQYIYLVEAFYMYCSNLSQLIGLVNYNRYDADGNKFVTNIATTVDPYQDNTSIVVDLSDYNSDVVLNGNSSFSATILPNADVKLTMYTKRITTSFGRNLQEFLYGEIISNNPNFFDNYGNLASIIALNEYLSIRANPPATDGVFGGNLALGQGISWNKPQEGLYRRNEVPVKGEQGFEENQEVIKPDIINQENDKVPIVMLSIAALSVAVLLIKKD
jgi:hypothetical protein